MTYLFSISPYLRFLNGQLVPTYRRPCTEKNVPKMCHGEQRVLSVMSWRGTIQLSTIISSSSPRILLTSIAKMQAEQHVHRWLVNHWSPVDAVARLPNSHVSTVPSVG